MTGNKDALAAPLTALGLTLRAYNAMTNNGFRTIKDVVAMTEADLARLPRLGQATVNEIKTKLGARGLALRDGGFGDSDWGPC